MKSSGYLIALDWGTSNLRATLLDAGGGVMEARSAPGGIMSVKDGQFAAALMSLCADWIAAYDCPVIASGMIGSRQGWKEAPYLDCPATAEQLAGALTRVDIATAGDGAKPRYLHIIPGLRCLESNGQFDVMRGEETQIWGAGLKPGSTCVLPGTHSKWAWLGADGDIATFRTYMTGELYGLLTKHGILGRLMTFGHTSPDDFLLGAQVGLDSYAHLSHAIFSGRTAGLMGSVRPEGLPDYLSGLLIGAELGSALAPGSGRPAPTQVHLIGDEELCHRYEKVFALAGIQTARAPDNATTAGQWMVATKAGLIQAAP